MTDYLDRKSKYNTGAYDRPMTEAPTRMFGLIIFILRSKVENSKQFPVLVKHYGTSKKKKKTFA